MIEMSVQINFGQTWDTKDQAKSCSRESNFY